jgi:hypothetical protein
VIEGIWLGSHLPFGDLLFANHWDRCEIWDVSDPSSPMPLSGFTITVGDEARCHVATADSGRLYATYPSDYGVNLGLQIFDISDPGTPVLAGGFDQLLFRDAEVLSDGLLAVGELDGLLILNVSDPELPVEVARFVPSGPNGLTGDLAVSGDHVLLATGSAHPGVVVVDISDPTRPREIGFRTWPESPLDLAAAGRLLVTADGEAGVSVLDARCRSIGDLPNQPDHVSAVD